MTLTLFGKIGFGLLLVNILINLIYVITAAITGTGNVNAALFLLQSSGPFAIIGIIISSYFVVCMVTGRNFRT